MSIEYIQEEFSKRAGNLDPIGAKVKMEIDDMAIIIDGTGNSNKILLENGEADCTIRTSLEDLEKMRSGELNPMMAVMMGKIKISGDMGAAMKVQGFLS
jgi:putative sterol carrier protein